MYIIALLSYFLRRRFRERIKWQVFKQWFFVEAVEECWHWRSAAVRCPKGRTLAASFLLGDSQCVTLILREWLTQVDALRLGSFRLGAGFDLRLLAPPLHGAHNRYALLCVSHSGMRSPGAKSSGLVVRKGALLHKQGSYQGGGVALKRYICSVNMA